MKRGFTLIEMLITVTVLAILMSIVFKLAGVSDEEAARLLTVTRVQRLENCLSGYYAAYGSYPPVALHGSRDIYAKTDATGQRTTGERNEGVLDDDDDSEQTTLNAAQVMRACRSQPVGCNFPYFNDGDIQNIITMWAEACRESIESGRSGSVGDEKMSLYGAGFNGLGTGGSANSIVNRHRYTTNWNQCQVFRFGLMSFLLPRYRFMTQGAEQMYELAQWTKNNSLPCAPSGDTYSSWQEVCEKARKAFETDEDGKMTPKALDAVRDLENSPSQKVCSRWISNLEGICACNYPRLEVRVFGVDISDREVKNINRPNLTTPRLSFDIYVPDEGSNSNPYVLDGITVLDGWENELLYYSPPPYQSYRLWSAGANGKTFPPWISRKDLNARQNKTVSSWIKDDIIHISN